MTPEMQEGISIARKENPNLAPVESYGLLSRIFLPSAMGYASPGRSIYLNPTMMQGQSPQDVADILTHEQKHVGQMQERGLGPTREFLNMLLGGLTAEPYHRRPDEIEAYNAETQRRMKMGRGVGVKPSFMTGEFISPMDKYLPPEN